MNAADSVQVIIRCSSFSIRDGMAITVPFYDASNIQSLISFVTATVPGLTKKIASGIWYLETANDGLIISPLNFNILVLPGTTVFLRLGSRPSMNKQRRTQLANESLIGSEMEMGMMSPRMGGPGMVSPGMVNPMVSPRMNPGMMGSPMMTPRFVPSMSGNPWGNSVAPGYNTAPYSRKGSLLRDFLFG